MADPFTKVYDEIVKAFRDTAKGRFRLVDWNSSRNPQHDRPTAQDLPEVQIRPDTSVIVLGARSCATTVVKDFAVNLTTGDFILGKILYPTEWVILGILHRLQYSLVEDLDLAEDVTVQQITTGILDPQANRGIVGWASTWNISVHMSFAASELES
jgi:hypothetical protein